MPGWAGDIGINGSYFLAGDTLARNGDANDCQPVINEARGLISRAVTGGNAIHGRIRVTLQRTQPRYYYSEIRCAKIVSKIRFVRDGREYKHGLQLHGYRFDGPA